MSPFAWLLGLALPAIGAEGAAGLPPPARMDMNRIERPASPNMFLAGPAGMTPAPDLVVEPAAGTAEALFERVRRVFESQPRTHVAAVFPQQRQVHYVVRSALVNYPDLVTVQADPAGPDTASLTIWSRSVYGRRDFGVNKERVAAWLAALRRAGP